MPRSLVVVALLALLAPVALAGQALPAPIPGTESPLTPAERGAALAELRPQGEGVPAPPKRLLLGATEVMAVNLLVWSYNRYVADAFDAYPGGDTIYWAHVSPDSWRKNLQEGFDWDDNQFSNNQIAHPYHGSLYFNAARSNGFGYWESWPFAFLGSWTWEYFGETYRPAYNDWLNTSLGGIALGEMLFRASTMVTDNTAPMGTAFTVTVDAKRGVTTGTSAYDRALTVRALVDPATLAEDLARPGHILPLRSMPGGVLRRAGHTEDRHIQASALHQRLQRGKDLLVGEIPGDAEQHQRVGSVHGAAQTTRVRTGLPAK